MLDYYSTSAHIADGTGDIIVLAWKQKREDGSGRREWLVVQGVDPLGTPVGEPVYIHQSQLGRKLHHRYVHAQRQYRYKEAVKNLRRDLAKTVPNCEFQETMRGPIIHGDFKEIRHAAQIPPSFTDHEACQAIRELYGPPSVFQGVASLDLPVALGVLGLTLSADETYILCHRGEYMEDGLPL